MLNISNNALESCSKEIGNLKNLNKLLLSHNNLSTLPLSITKLPRLSSGIEIEYNKLCELSVEVIQWLNTNARFNRETIEKSNCSSIYYLGEQDTGWNKKQNCIENTEIK